MLGAAALQDLMLQAEILVQYGMRSKAIERLQRIQQLFPREEERNQDLQQLYLAAGMTPHYADSIPPRISASPGASRLPRALRQLLRRTVLSRPPKPRMSAASPGWRKSRANSIAKAMPTP